MKFKRFLVVVLLIISIVLATKIFINYYHTTSVEATNKKNIEVINKSFNNSIKDNTKSIISVNLDTLNNKKVVANVIGKIIINKINIDYPILDGATSDNLDISITRFYGSRINSIGNCILAGHNMRDGALFGKLMDVDKGDSIMLQDTSGNKKEYKIFKIMVISPTNISILSQDTNNSRWVTLITCTNHGKSRLIVQAKEV